MNPQLAFASWPPVQRGTAAARWMRNDSDCWLLANMEGLKLEQALGEGQDGDKGLDHPCQGEGLADVGSA